nr:MAG TPA: hypothetical protein [Caudoviricetes sp.]
MIKAIIIVRQVSTSRNSKWYLKVLKCDTFKSICYLFDNNYLKNT